MLTPNEILEQRRRISVLSIDSMKTLALKNFYEEILKEIARGTLDPRSLAIAAIKPIKNNS